MLYVDYVLEIRLGVNSIIDNVVTSDLIRMSVSLTITPKKKCKALKKKKNKVCAHLGPGVFLIFPATEAATRPANPLWEITLRL